MQSIKWTAYSRPSLIFSLLMGLVTLVHHLHSGLVLHPNGGSMHIVWNEIVLIPATIVSMYIFLRSGSKAAFWIYIFIALLGFIFLGLYEGGWNHTANIIAHLRIDGDTNHITEILPPDNFHLWFYELTGVATFFCAMIASWFSLRFYLCTTDTAET